MKSISENRLFKVMENFMLLNFETLSEPLEVNKTIGKGNNTPMSGVIMFGSDSRYDYFYYVKEYSEPVSKETWFWEYSDNNPHIYNKWMVNEKMEIMYEMFGEELFEDFVLYYFNIDLRNKGGKSEDWSFWEFN
jgi:hypothetical protein